MTGWKKNGLIFFRILLLVLAAAVFTNFAEVFENSQIGEVSFYMVYLLLFTILMNSYQQLGVSLGKQLEWMTQFMKGLAPAYFVAVSAASGAVTASVFYQGVLLLVWLVEWLLLTLILPGANLYVLLLYGEPSFQRGYVKQDGRASGNYDQLEPENHAWGCPWASGGTRIGCACHGCHQTNCPGQNCRSNSGCGKCRKCGNRIDSGRALLVKNCLGAMAVVVLLLAGAGPVIHYGLLSLSFRFLGAVAQPVSDKRIVGCLGTMGEGCALLLRIMLTAEILCVLTFIVLMASVGG